MTERAGSGEHLDKALTFSCAAPYASPIEKPIAFQTFVDAKELLANSFFRGTLKDQRVSPLKNHFHVQCRSHLTSRIRQHLVGRKGGVHPRLGPRASQEEKWRMPSPQNTPTDCSNCGTTPLVHCHAGSLGLCAHLSRPHNSGYLSSLRFLACWRAIPFIVSAFCNGVPSQWWADTRLRRWPVALLRRWPTPLPRPRASLCRCCCERCQGSSTAKPRLPRTPALPQAALWWPRVDGHMSMNGQRGVTADEDVSRGGPGTGG